MSIQTTRPTTDVTDRDTRQLGEVSITDNYQDQYLPLILNEIKRAALLVEGIHDTLDLPFYSGLIYLTSTPPLLSSGGVVNVGNGGFYGTGVAFAGSSSGTYLATNALRTFTGNFLDFQLAGVSKFSVDTTGAVTAASTVTAGTNAAPFPLTSSLTKASGDTAMTSAGTFYDGPTVSCVAGTWLVIAGCTVVGQGLAGKLTGKLWDGTTALTSQETNVVGSSGVIIGMTLAAVVSPGSTTIYKMSVTSTTASYTLKAAAVDNGAGNNATWIVAVRLA